MKVGRAHAAGQMPRAFRGQLPSSARLEYPEFHGQGSCVGGCIHSSNQLVISTGNPTGGRKLAVRFASSRAIFPLGTKSASNAAKSPIVASCKEEVIPRVTWVKRTCALMSRFASRSAIIRLATRQALLTLNPVHTRLGHSGSATDPAMMESPQSACTNVLWFDLVAVVWCTPLSRQFETEIKIGRYAVYTEIHRCRCLVVQRLMETLPIVKSEVRR